MELLLALFVFFSCSPIRDTLVLRKHLDSH